MARMLHILSALAIFAASGIFALCVFEWSARDSELQKLRGRPSVVQLFREGTQRHRLNAEEKLSPLVAQAREFATYLNPPSPPAEKGISGSAPRLPSRATQAVRPAALSLRFVLQGTSYYPDQPGRSMALVSEPGGSEADGKWVKEGDRLGHFVVHEIRKGTVVFRTGDDLRELAVEKRRPSRSLVRDVRSGARQANAALPEGAAAPLPAGPNTVGIPGGN